MPTVQLIAFEPEVYDALLADDLAGASARVGAALPASFLAEDAHWRRRRDQIRVEAATAPWLVRAVINAEGEVVGNAGFHGPPDARGMVEMGYAILAPHRRRGYATAAVQGLVAYAVAHGAKVLRASIAPDNGPSLALAHRLGLVHVGEHWDDEDGPELEFELSLPRS